MCNFLHEPVTPIEEEGIAYKLFRKSSSGYEPLCGYGYSLSIKETIAWIKKYNLFGNGFCMLMTERSAKKALVEFNFCGIDCLCKIRYKRGLGKFREPNFCDGVSVIALCKEFQIIEEVTE